MARAATKKKPAAKPVTKWGDREGRRRDILDAARADIEGGGYLTLNMRDIATGAGVSPGTLYSYFATKEEIFATLYAEAIERHNDRLEPMCDAATDLEPFLADLARAYLDLYGAYGRYFTMWSVLQAEGDAADSPLPKELGVALRSATKRNGALVIDTIRRICHERGLTLVDEPFVGTYVWLVLNGLGDQVTSDRRHLTPFTADELIAHAARAIAAGITKPA